MDSSESGRIPHFPPGSFVAEIDGAKARTLRGFYPRIAKTLHFPDYFGKNLDALFDCLCSLEAVGSQHVILYIKNYHQFLSSEKPEKRQDAIKVLHDAEKHENRTDGVHFKVHTTH